MSYLRGGRRTFRQSWLVLMQAFFSSTAFPPLWSDSEIPKLAQAGKLASAAVLLPELEPPFLFPPLQKQPSPRPSPASEPDPLPVVSLERFKKKGRKEPELWYPGASRGACFPGRWLVRESNPVAVGCRVSDARILPCNSLSPQKKQVIKYF